MKEDWGKKGPDVILRETGSFVRVRSGEFYIRLWSIRILARLTSSNQWLGSAGGDVSELSQPFHLTQRCGLRERSIFEMWNLWRPWDEDEGGERGKPSDTGTCKASCFMEFIGSLFK